MEYKYTFEDTTHIIIIFFSLTVNRPRLSLLMLSTQPGGCAFL